jgi:CBS domain-containing protein
MQVQEIMTTNPACCEPQDSLQDAVQLMINFDCGEIPVVEDRETCIPIGVITDRDVACRSVGKGLNPLEMTVSDCMSTPLVSVRPEDSLHECYRTMEENQIRRVPVVDAGGKCVGIVSLADIARNVSRADSGEVLQEVSAETLSASNVS